MSVLKKPLVTEKSTGLGESLQQYAFVVDKKATKPEIKTAIENYYKVEVNRINTMVYAGKVKSRFTKAGNVSGRGKSFKKAIVTLKNGQTIDFYENI